MASVTVSINGHNYAVDCNDGEEAQLQALAAEVDAKVQDVVRMVGQIGDLRLLLMASMLIVDDGHVLQGKLDATERALADLRKAHAELQGHVNDAESFAADKLEAAAGRVEAVLQTLSGGDGQGSAEFTGATDGAPQPQS